MSDTLIEGIAHPQTEAGHACNLLGIAFEKLAVIDRKLDKVLHDMVVSPVASLRKDAEEQNPHVGVFSTGDNDKMQAGPWGGHVCRSCGNGEFSVIAFSDETILECCKCYNEYRVPGRIEPIPEPDWWRKRISRELECKATIKTLKEKIEALKKTFEEAGKTHHLEWVPNVKEDAGECCSTESEDYLKDIVKKNVTVFQNLRAAIEKSLEEWSLKGRPFQIVYAKHEKVPDIWKVTIEYASPFIPDMKGVMSFKIHAKTFDEIGTQLGCKFIP